MQSTQDYLQIINVSKSYGNFWALREVSLAIAKGEFVCFLGPSGCGKTTLLRILAGLEAQSSGELFQAGQNISDRAASERDFGIVFQSYALFPNLNVQDNVAYGLVNRRHARDQVQARVRDLLELVGLQAAKDQFPSELSGGMQQRVALARALALSPGLLLLDEPLSALDARVRAHLRSEIRKLHGSLDITTVMVTHDQEEALTMADRIVVMNKGRIEQVGTPEEVYSNPSTPFVANFVGMSNRIDARVTAANQVDWGSQQVLTCKLPLGLAPGKPVSLAIRPEHIKLHLNGVRPNTLGARVRGIEFLGPFCRVALHVDDYVEHLVADLSTEQVRELSLKPGLPLAVHIPSDRIQVFEGHS
jgi:iron(III) transport system ATP-binding protein